MADRAKITSVEALESFQNVLVVYLDKARRAMDEINDEVKRTRTWVESDRHVHWKNEVKRRTRLLEMKQQELFSARIGNISEPTQAHQQAVRKARRSLDEANEKLAQIRRWAREYDNRVEPVARHVDKLRHTLTVDMGKAVISLKQTIEALHKYAEVHQASATSGPNRSEPETSS
jgi:DNA repair ATPase RecN